MRFMRQTLENMDFQVISYMRKNSIGFGRIALFVVFFWFGILKVVGTSSANPLVSDLLHTTLPFVTFEQFILAFGIYEMLIGVSFLIKGWERFAIALLIPHMITTLMPLILLPSITWQGPFTPTLEGQYIIKNLLILALASVMASHMVSFKERNV